MWVWLVKVEYRSEQKHKSCSNQVVDTNSHFFKANSSMWLLTNNLFKFHKNFVFKGKLRSFQNVQKQRNKEAWKQYYYWKTVADRDVDINEFNSLSIQKQSNLNIFHLKIRYVSKNSSEIMLVLDQIKN